MALIQGSLVGDIILEDAINGQRTTGILKTNLGVGEIINDTILDNPNIKFNYKGTYYVDLNFWGLTDTATPLETTQALNRLSKWASKSPALTDIVFIEASTFKLDVEQDTIESKRSSAYDSNANQYPHYFAWILQGLKGVNINCGGSTFELIPNIFTRYQNVYILDCENFKLNNFYIKGERIGHDYTTNVIASGAHEHGHGILMEGNCINVTIEDGYISKVMGYGFGMYETEPYKNSLFSSSIELPDIESGYINTYGVNDQDEEQVAFISTDYTRTIMKDLPVGYYNLPYFNICGLGFFSAKGLIDNCVITVFWFDENDVLLDTITTDEGARIPKPLLARKYKMMFNQPLFVTKWFEGAIDASGADIPLSTAQQAAQNSTNYGRTELTPFTEKELTLNVDTSGNRYFRPRRLQEDTFFNYGAFTGITVYFYDAANAFISEIPFTNDMIQIPATATQWRMFGSNTPYNTKDERFQVFLSPLGTATNVTVKNVHFIENRAMGGAGICNGLTVEKCSFIRNGKKVQGRGKDSNLGWGWNCEEGHKINKNMVFKNNRFVDNFEGCIVLLPMDNVTITGNYFDDRKIALHEKINNVVMENNIFKNCDSGLIAPEFYNINPRLINCRIDSLYGKMINPRFKDCYIEGGTAANGFDAESLEEIIINGGVFEFTDDFSKNEFIKTYSKTRVVLNECEIINDSEKNIGLINSDEFVTGFRIDTAIGLKITKSIVKGFRLLPDSRISEISDSEVDFRSISGASFKDSSIDAYKGLTINNNNNFTIRPITGSAVINFDFDLKVTSNKNNYNMVGRQRSGTYSLDFTQGLDSRGDTFLYEDATTASAFRTAGDVKFIRSEVRVPNPAALIEHNGTLEEFQPLYSPARQI